MNETKAPQKAVSVSLADLEGGMSVLHREDFTVS